MQCFRSIKMNVQCTRMYVSDLNRYTRLDRCNVRFSLSRKKTRCDQTSYMTWNHNSARSVYKYRFVNAM